MKTIFGFANDTDGNYELLESKDYPFAVNIGDTIEWPDYGETTVSCVAHFPWGDDGDESPHRYVVVRP